MWFWLLFDVEFEKLNNIDKNGLSPARLENILVVKCFEQLFKNVHFKLWEIVENWWYWSGLLQCCSKTILPGTCRQSQRLFGKHPRRDRCTRFWSFAGNLGRWNQWWLPIWFLPQRHSLGLVSCARGPQWFDVEFGQQPRQCSFSSQTRITWSTNWRRLMQLITCDADVNYVIHLIMFKNVQKTSIFLFNSF